MPAGRSAIVPPGADAVVMVERTEESADGSRVRIDAVPSPGDHIRRRAEDLEAGAEAVQPGLRLEAAEIAALTSLGKTRVRVHREPVVHVLSTGDEIVEPDRRPADHQVRNSNAHALVGQLAELGIDGRYLGIAGDDTTELDALLKQGLAGDALLITGGVSAGRYDLVADALERSGMRQLFHKVEVKPGKPILAGRSGDCLVFGLPGNPVSTFATFAVFVAPSLRRMQGYARWQNRTLPAMLAAPLAARPGRETYHLARIDTGNAGLLARRVAATGSGDVLALTRANGFIVTPAEGGDLAAGTAVRVLVWRGFETR
jgi:molybdopterin molybdotransferase